ncbi:MAG: glycosyltransferase family 4 protein [Flavobacteriales bacterium]
MKIANVVLNPFTRDNRVLKMARTLQEAGHDVTVFALSGPGLPERETRPEGWKVQRIPIGSDRLPRSPIFGAIKFSELIVRVVRMTRSAEIMHCNDVEAYVIGLFAKAINRELRLVYDCHEYEAERIGKPEWQKTIIRWIERRFIHHADAVLMVSPSIAQAYREDYGPKRVSKTWLVRNAPDPDPHVQALSSGESPSYFRDHFDISEEAMIFLYQGSLSRDRGIEHLVEAMSILTSTRDDIHMVFMGFGRLESWLVKLAEERKHIHFHPAVDYEKVLAISASADVGIVSTQPTCKNHLFCLPNKLFEYIQAGIPVLSNALVDAKSLLLQYGAGVAVDADTPDSWAQAMIHMRETPLDDWRAGAQRAGAEINWPTEARQLLAAYREVISSMT